MAGLVTKRLYDSLTNEKYSLKPMQNLAIDTNAYRALSEGNQILADKFRAAATIGMPVIVLGELYDGFYNGSKTDQNLTQLDKFMNTARLQLLQVDEQTAQIFGEISTYLRNIGKPIQQDDIWIASLCKQHGFMLATNDGGFQYITGLRLLTF